ncbi:MAG TPA: CRISPR-associated helicase Cas3' [Methanocorpusculum sp.]|nr:CRISPR-associated helicase Cas3' [Methanocorpusculum sp.]HJJ53641.1 CRISPR-associated helicase Cas3' [Methanocorpusculum sp.]
MTEYYARCNDDHTRYQTITDHLTNVSDLAGMYAKTFTTQEMGEICGRFHDIGKYSDDFQKRIKGENIQTDHSTAGAKTAHLHALEQQGENKPESALAYYLLSYIIAGHHGGLPNRGHANAPGLYQRLQNSDPELFAAWKNEMPFEFPNLADFFTKQTFIPQDRSKFDKKEFAFSIFLYTHFLYSCLIDADRTDAAQWDGYVTEGSYPSLEEMNAALDQHMAKFTGDSELQKIRNNILTSCNKAAEIEPGIFTLNVPTGGGKTLSSLSFALKHALKNHQTRIIYTIPFTSIIEQNAKVYADIFGRNNVVEHHSNFVLPTGTKVEPDSPDGENLNLSLAAANWCAPLIMTTNVQFFESLFTSHSSRSRKVHNIANSVIILDEVQALPNEFLIPCMYALAELVKNYHCTVVLCTATQPDFVGNNILPKYSIVKDIVPNYKELAEKMKRAKAQNLGYKTIDEIASLLISEEQVLCIVNTKKHAQELYSRVKEFDGSLHLSTNMCPKHRKQVIETIRSKLKNKQPCRVISTQLIEAGVDLDFPVVYRSLAGLDSIVQAAGRCNREGKLPCGTVYIYDPEQKYAGFGYVKQTAEIAHTIQTDDYLSLDAIDKYFSKLFDIRYDKLDDKGILELCGQGFETSETSFPFADISDKFKLISESGCAVIIPFDAEAKRLIKNYSPEMTRSFIRKISPYCVNVRKTDLDYLSSKGAVSLLGESFVVLEKQDEFYENDIGIHISGKPDMFDYVL